MRENSRFDVWLLKIDMRTCELEAAVSSNRRSEVAACERELNTCNAWLLLMLDDFERGDISVASYHDRFMTVFERLQRVRVKLKSKGPPWWKKALEVVDCILASLSAILQIRLPRIPRFLYDETPRLPHKPNA
jgi:hypothetical protein